MKYLIIFVILAGLVGGGAYLVSNRAKASAASSGPAQTDRVLRTTIEKVVTANGKIASNRDLDVKCQASGTIMELPYKDVSAPVKPGALLLKLDPKDMQRQLDTALAVLQADQSRIDEAVLNKQMTTLQLATTTSRNQASLASAQARAADARAKATRTKSLFDSNLASKEELETANTTATTAEAEVRNAEAAMQELEQMKVQILQRDKAIEELQLALKQDKTRAHIAQQNVDYCTVTAPEADDPKDPPKWVISSLMTNIAVGGVVQSGTSGFSGGTTVMTLSDLSHVFVLASVDESDIGKIGDPARGDTSQKVHVSVDAYPHQIFEGRVVRVASKGVNTSNVVTFEVKIEVTDEKRSALRPEMTGTAKIVIGERVDALTILAQNFMRKQDDPKDDTSAATQPVALVTPATTPRADTAATGPASQPASRPGRGARGGRGGRGFTGMPDDGPQEGTVTVLVNGKEETRDVVVGLLGSVAGSNEGERYEVVSGLQEGEEVVVKSFGADSKWRNNGPGAQQMGRMLNGGRRGR